MGIYLNLTLGTLLNLTLREKVNIMEIPTSVIAQNVRAFLLDVDDLTTTKFKDVRRAVEKRLGLAKHSLDEKKDEMKDIIKVFAPHSIG